MTLYLFNYKNYYNRFAKSQKYISDYLDDETATLLDIIDDYDFNPNDGIWSSVILNTEYSNGDYLIVVDEYRDIVSRWYLLESTRKRAEQYHCKLLRDVIADYKDIIINSPCFIEKATVKYGNPLLFNNEAMTFNQIKSNEILLRDKTCCPWIVGYINKDVSTTQITAPLKDNYVAEYASLQAIPFYSASQIGLRVGTDFSVRIGYQAGTIGGSKFYTKFNSSGLIAQSLYPDGAFDDIRTVQGPYYTSTGAINAYEPIANKGSAFLRNNSAEFNEAVNTTLNLTTENNKNEFLAQYTTSGEVIKVGNSYYNIYRDTGTTKTIYYQVESTDSEINNYLNRLVNDTGVIEVKDASGSYRCYEITYTLTTYRLFLNEITLTNEYKTTIPTTRNHLNDAPYDMFAIPYNTDVRLSVQGSGTYDIASCDAYAGMAIASKIAETLGDRVYDLQLLPYCPFRSVVKRLADIDHTGLTADTDYSFITKTVGSNQRDVSIILWCNSSEFSFSIDKARIPVVGAVVEEEFELTVNEADAKVQSQCDMHRLVSPNYNGQFEFNVVKNGGVDFFTVDCTYKPYSPYIRVAPNFGGLYGRDYDDARGLICGGDFSLPTTTDQWKQYELNNKNYLNAFNRQIENLEVQQKYQRIGEIANVITGTASAGVTGGMTGGLVGGPYGAAIGATAGAGLSALGGTIDVSINDKLRTEALDYTKDQFGYQLGNIQALPYSLNRVSSFNINNKIFPVLEYYTCTDIEKQALRDKVKYNGMTIETIGTIAQYIQDEVSYIKGRVIRIDQLKEDYHLAVAIAEEIYKGVFI